jgi:putative peptidoglycan lipid II flippase
MHPGNKTIRSVFIVTIFSIIGKLTGFIREAVIASYYGAGSITDAYFVAYSLPSILFSIIGGSMGLIFVPIYTQQLSREPEKSHALASNIINMVFSLILIIAGLGSVFSRQIIALIAPRLSANSMDIAAYLARIMFPAFIFISISYIATGVLQSHESFAIPSMVSIPSNLIIAMGAALFSGVYGIYTLAWATLAGGASQLAIQLPALAKKIEYRMRISIREPSSLAYWKLVVPSILGSSIDKLNILVDNAMASFLLAGSISAINYSTKLIDFADNIAIGAIIAVAYPKFARLNSKEDYEKLGHMAHKAIMGITQITLPMIAITMIFSKDIVKAVFERGAFVEADTRLTAYALFYYALGIWGIGIRGILNRVFYSLGDTSTPMKISIITLVSNIALNILLVRYMGVGGLGLATSVSSTVGVLALFIFIRRDVGTLNIKGLTKEALKVILAVICMVYVIKKYQVPQIIGNYYIDLILKIAIGLSIYIMLSWLIGAGMMKRKSMLRSRFLRGIYEWFHVFK